MFAMLTCFAVMFKYVCDNTRVPHENYQLQKLRDHKIHVYLNKLTNHE